MWQYMPGQHRAFLQHVSTLRSLRKLVDANDDADLRQSYERCLKELRSWRSAHIAVVSKYIVRPARQAANGDGDVDDADDALKGTGGSALIPFLKQTRDETLP